MVRTFLFISLGVSLACFTCLGLSATQGTLGTTSTGTVDVDIEIGDLVQISGLSDIDLATVTDPSSDVTGNTTACIYTNEAGGGYAITVSSANTTGTNFRVREGVTANYIVYTTEWNDQDASGGTAVSSGVKLTSQTGANISQTNCGGTPNARLNLTFPSANLSGATPGSYTDTVTLLVEPS